MLMATSRSITGHTLSADAADRVGDGMVAALAGFGGRVRRGVPIPDWLPVRDNRRMRGGMRAVHRVTRAAIAAARGPSADEGNVLAILLAARDDHTGRPAFAERELVDEIAVMFALGGHQMALALSWAAHLLSLHPDVANRLAHEADVILGGRIPSAADVERLPFAGMVIDETLRLYPPFFLVVREAATDCELGGFRIDRGTTIGLSTWATHRSPTYFDEPDAFRPERWAGGLARRLPRFAYFPYGGGARVCIARAFVHAQLVLALATIARRFRLDPAGDHVVAPRPETALGMRDGLHVRIRRR
jgi:cytochrome P450